MQRFFDGLEGEPAVVTFPCAACGAAVAVDAWAFVSDAVSHDAIPDRDVAAFGLDRHAVGTLTVTVTPDSDGLSAYIGTVGCACGRRHRVAIGLGEFQPCRYVASWIGAIPQD